MPATGRQRWVGDALLERGDLGVGGASLARAPSISWGARLLQARQHLGRAAPFVAALTRALAMSTRWPRRRAACESRVGLEQVSKRFRSASPRRGRPGGGRLGLAAWTCASPGGSPRASAGEDQRSCASACARSPVHAAGEARVARPAARPAARRRPVALATLSSRRRPRRARPPDLGASTVPDARTLPRLAAAAGGDAEASATARAIGSVSWAVSVVADGLARAPRRAPGWRRVRPRAAGAGPAAHCLEVLREGRGLHAELGEAWRLMAREGARHGRTGWGDDLEVATIGLTRRKAPFSSLRRGWPEVWNTRP